MDHPYLNSDFEIRWSQLRPEAIEADIQKALDDAQQRIDTLANSGTEDRSFENTLLALEDSTEALGRAWGLVTHLDSVCNSDALRAAYNAMLPKISEFHAKIPLNEGLWKVLKAYEQTEEAGQLTGARKRFLDETLADFREHGADLPPEKKQRLQKLETELSQITQKFGENVLDATNDWELVITDSERLAGLPETSRTAAYEDALAKEKGTPEQPAWRFTLHMPSLQPALQYLDDAELRKQIWEASAAVGYQEPYENTELIRKSLQLRHEKAQIFGKEDFSDHILQRRMAKNGKTADDFVTDLHDRIYKVFCQEIEDLQNYKARKTNTEPELLAPWDIAYWSEKQRKELYDFDEEILRPYFPINNVINGMFELTQKVFDIQIKQRPSTFIEAGDAESEAPLPKDTVEVWHPEVQYYDMFDASTGRKMGSFFADWHPREPKRGGAWMNFLRTGEIGDNGVLTPHLGLICGNLTPSTQKKPALLTHREVETVFHEFGHLLHHLCGEVEIKSLNGVEVAWDFVELPSQIMENWCWERDSLDLFARHYATGAPIPEDLFEKMLRSRNYQSGMFNMRQLAFGKMDLELHRKVAKDQLDEDLDSQIREILADYTIPTNPKAPNIARRFTHLFSSSVGYASAYYSYKWAEVLDADAFTRFKKEGIMNKDTGKDFRKTILSKGNSEDPAKLYRDFMGRDPKLDALLERAGIA